MKQLIEDKTMNTENNSNLLEGFIPVCEQKPQHFIEGKRNWVLAAWSGNKQRVKVYADKIGTESCTADYWKPILNSTT